MHEIRINKNQIILIFPTPHCDILKAIFVTYFIELETKHGILKTSISESSSEKCCAFILKKHDIHIEFFLNISPSDRSQRKV